MTAFLAFTIVVSAFYLLLICRYLSGWNSIPEQVIISDYTEIKVSIIVAFRNEEKNLHTLCKALTNQTYPSKEIEIIFVDDHSDDQSDSIIREYASSATNFRLLLLDSQSSGKKSALALAALHSRGELLIFTDADCIPGNEWIRSIVSFYLESGAILIASPVIVRSGKRFFDRFQSLEFFSLTGTTAGAFGLGNPVMMNGANFAVVRDKYLESIGSLKNQTISGDDVFLLYHLKLKYREKLKFLKSRDATVIVEPHSEILSFIHQRLRWTSKARYYRDKSVIFSAVTVLTINLLLLFCLIMLFFNRQYFLIGLGVLLVKSIIDYFFLIKIIRYFRMPGLRKSFVISQFFYFFYISFVGLAGNFVPSIWKGRIVK